MYQPADFVETDSREIRWMIRDNPFANLVIWDGTELRATPVPILRRGPHESNSDPNPEFTLVGHLAKGNDLATILDDEAVERGCPAIVTFTGPNGYISPSAYPSKAEHGKVVPTWNYETVLVYGTMRVITDKAWVLGVVTELTDHFERGRSPKWAVDDAPASYIEAMLNGIVGIEITPSRLEAKRKLSQNRPEADREGVMEDLEMQEGSERQNGPAEQLAIRMRSRFTNWGGSLA
jgi:transcriptional regulator